MKHFAPQAQRVEKDVITRTRRTLGGKGQLNVASGQIVAPHDIIGSATVPAGFRTINLATLLSVSPSDVGKYLTRKIGQRIYKDELLAYKKGWLLGGEKVVVSPTDGVLDFVNNKTGELKIIFLPKKVDLPAGVYGVVEEVDQRSGQVIIRTQVSRIYGMMGSGKLRDGILHILGHSDELVSPGAVQTKYDGHILVGGSLFFKEAISVAISAGVSGLISGGVNAKDYRGMAGGRLVFPRRLETDIGVSIVVCEGFGAVPIADDIYQVLSQYEGKFVFIDGNKALISLPSPTESSLSRVKGAKLPEFEETADEYSKGSDELKVGIKVRIVGNSYLGEQGKLLAIDDSLTLLPSGIKTTMATVLGKKRKIQVPVANLELIV